MTEKLRNLMWMALLCMATSPVCAQNYTLPKGKAIYIPKDLKEYDLTCDTSRWCYKHMAWTDNVVLFWEKGFGDDVASAPDLDGHNMKVDIPHLLDRIEHFYAYYRDSLKFVLPGSKSEKYRMMVMLNYSLEGTAYGGDYDSEIGALWIAPNRLQDEKLNCIAHELGHSFQSQISCDGLSGGMGGGIYEMTSQWMLWLVNPEWVKDENYHWEAFRHLFHKRFLSGENIYHSPYVLEYWSQKRGLSVMADLWRKAKRGEDPAQVYMRVYGLSLADMADEMYDCYARLLTFDDDRVREVCKPYACQLSTPMEKGKKWIPNAKFVPETYGFNVVELPLGKHKVQFKGLGTQGKDGYRYGVVLVDKEKHATYLTIQREWKGTVKYQTKEDTEQAFLVVVGCPKDEYSPMTWGEETAAERTYPYEITVK